jgi:hypothetical protein
MIRKLVLLLVVFLGLTGCTRAVDSFYHSSTPGLLPLPGGGAVQLFYSNPNFDPNLRDSVPRYGRNSGEPTVTGGIGAMAIWSF